MKKSNDIKSLTFKKLAADSRGEIFGLELDSRSAINVQTINQGYARGGHSHQYDEIFCVVTGLVEFHTGTTTTEKMTLHAPGSVMRTIPGEPHYLLAREPSVLVEVRPWGAEYSAETYEPFRRIVLSLMQEKPKT